METRNDYSYGVVPVRKQGDTWEVFVLHQIARADTYWTFPKGHADEGETNEETALRELHEETGLTPVELDTGQTFNQQYTFKHEGAMIDKKVSYYLGYMDESTPTLQADEVVEARWCTFPEARELLTYDLSKALLDEVATYLETKT